MTSPNATFVSSLRDRQLSRRVLAFLLLVTIARSIAIITSPLELGVDEAQYWLWSQAFDFGYYTKPPLTSWIIGLSHARFGHEIWAVRLPAPWLHLATALVLGRVAHQFYGPAGARWASILWILLPATSLGSFVISTDTPLLLAWSLGLWALAHALNNDRARTGMMLAGAAFGIGMLAKYAAIYALVGMVLLAGWHFISATQKTIKPANLALFILAMVIAASPNLLWNITNDFTTVRHLGDNANLANQNYDFGHVIDFVAAQFFVAGPVVFALMLLVLLPRQNDPSRRLAIAFSMPVLCAMMVQAYLSEANANWAITALPILVVWLSGWLASAGGLRWGLLANAVNGGIAAVFLMASMAGTLGPMTPKSDPLRHLRNWQLLAADIRPIIDAHEATLIVADRRASAALLSWHFYDQDVAIRVHDDDAIPSNHFEQNLAWSPQAGRRIIAIDGRDTPPALAGVTWQAQSTISRHSISDRRNRSLYIYRGIEQ